MAHRPTPGYNVHLQIAFTADRRGRPVAYRWSPSGHRWIRMNLAEARMLVAAEEATQVPYSGSLAERLNPPPRSPTSNDPRRRRRGRDPQHMSASDWAREMARLRMEKPRPLHKRYGPNPTAEQIARHKAEEREWSLLYRHASKMQKRQLAIDNAEFRRRHG